MRLLSRAGAGTSVIGFRKLSRSPILQPGSSGTAAAAAGMASNPSSSPDVAPPPLAPPAGSVSSRLYPNGLAVIELNRPGKLNALDADCCDAVSASLLALEKLVAEGRAGRGGKEARRGGRGGREARAGEGGGGGEEEGTLPPVLPRALLLTGSRGRGGAAAATRVAFCAGGDVRAIREAALARPVGLEGRGGGGGSEPPRHRRRPSFPLPPRGHPCERVFQAEYSMLSLLSAASFPVMTLVDGVQMGLGAGISFGAWRERERKGWRAFFFEF